jgi:hypothetical protein
LDIRESLIRRYISSSKSVPYDRAFFQLREEQNGMTPSFESVIRRTISDIANEKREGARTTGGSNASQETVLKLTEAAIKDHFKHRRNQVLYGKKIIALFPEKERKMYVEKIINDDEKYALAVFKEIKRTLAPDSPYDGIVQIAEYKLPQRAVPTKLLPEPSYALAEQLFKREHRLPSGWKVSPFFAVPKLLEYLTACDQQPGNKCGVNDVKRIIAAHFYKKIESINTSSLDPAENAKQIAAVRDEREYAFLQLESSFTLARYPSLRVENNIAWASTIGTQFLPVSYPIPSPDSNLTPKGYLPDYPEKPNYSTMDIPTSIINVGPNGICVKKSSNTSLNPVTCPPNTKGKRQRF